MGPDNEINHGDEKRRTRQLEAIFDAFEAKIRAHQSPSIEELLSKAPLGTERDVLAEFTKIALAYATESTECRADELSPGKTEPSSSLMGAVNGQAEGPICPANNVYDTHTSSPSISTSSSQTTARLPSLGEFVDYTILEPIGSGGMGAVYRARQNSVDRIVALKVLKAHSGESNGLSAERRFLRESTAAARQEHENIVTVFDAGECDGHYFVAMQYVDGQSLRQLIGDAPLANRRAAGYLLPVCRAVALMHSRGVLHRDLKPSNILIDRTTDQPLVADFGLAKLADGIGEATKSGEMFGSPPYMPPEQIVDASSVDETADVYGLGATLFHMLTGRPPFQAATLVETVSQVVARAPIPPRELNSAIDLDLETICLKCLEKEPRRRYASANLLAEDLARYLDRRPILARPPSLIERVLRWSDRNRLTAALLGGVFLLLATVAGGSSTMYFREIRTGRQLREAVEDGRRQLSFRYVASAALDQDERMGSALGWLSETLVLDRGNEPRQQANRRRIQATLASYPTLENMHWHAPATGQISIDASRHKVAIADQSEAITIFDVDSWTVRAKLDRHVHLKAMAFSSDGQEIATASLDGTIGLFNAASGQSLGVNWKRSAPIDRIQFISTGTRVLTTSTDQTACIWDRTRNSDDPIAELSHPKSVSCCDVSRDEATIATGCNDGLVRLWSSKDGKAVGEPLRHGNPVRRVRFSPNGKFLLTMGTGRDVLLWDLSISPSSSQKLSHNADVRDVLFTSDSAGVLTGTGDGTIHQWRVLDAAETRKLEGIGALKRLEVDADGRRLLSIHEGKLVRTWDIQKWAAEMPPISHPNEVSDAHLLPNNRLMTATVDGCWRIWEQPSAASQIRAKSSWPAEVGALSTASGHLAVLGKDFSVSVIDVRARQQFSCPAQLDQSATAVSWSPCGQFLAVGHNDGRCQIWNVTSNQIITGQAPNASPISILCWSNNGNFFLSGAKDGLVRMWNTSCEAIREFDLDKDRDVRVLAVDRTDTRMLAVSGNTLHVRQIVADAPDTSFQASPPAGQAITFAEFIGDGRAIRFLTANGLCTTWNWNAGESGEQFSASAGRLEHARTSNNGQHLATHGTEQIVRIWDVHERAYLKASVPVSSQIADVCFGVDDTLLAILCADGQLSVWDCNTGEPMGPRIATGVPAIALFFDPTTSRLSVLTKLGAVIQVESSTGDLADRELASWCRLVAGCRVNPIQGLVPMQPADLQSLWDQAQRVVRRPNTSLEAVESSSESSTSK